MRGYKGAGKKEKSGRAAPGLGVVKARKNREKKQKIRRVNKEDKKKLKRWKNPPSNALYSQYKAVYDNQKYFDQKTGEINWPRNRGFAGKPKKKILNPGTRIDRYGLDFGTFTSPEGTAYRMRAVAPGTNLRPYSVFEVMMPVNVKAGKIAPWFDEPGGGTQYEMPKSIRDLLNDGVIKRV